MHKPSSPKQSTPDDRRNERRRDRRRQDRRSAEFWQALYPERRQRDRRADSDVQASHPDVNSDEPAVETCSPSPADAISPDSDITPIETPPTGDTQRRDALLSMLATAEIRHAQALRRRRPALAAGVSVRVVSGPYVGDRGVVLDADYIHARVRVELAGERVPQWVDFDQVVAQQDDGVAG